MSEIKRNAVIFDMDGTLCDVTSVRHHVLNRPRDFEAFHRGSASCPAKIEVVADLWRARRTGHTVFILTGRQEKWRHMTTTWCSVRNITFDALLMRNTGDFRKDVAVKGEMLAEVMELFNVVHAWDDNPAIVELWEANGIPVTVVPGWSE